MERKIATTQEQLARLLRCGVSADTADMARYEEDEVPMMPWDWTTGSYGGTFPAWSLSALLAILPPSVTDEDGTYFQLQLTAYPHEEDCYKWILIYYSMETEISLLYDEAPDPIEACVLMVEILVENGYKLNEQ